MESEICYRFKKKFSRPPCLIFKFNYGYKSYDTNSKNVSLDNFDVDTSLVLVNAIYLKAKWLNSFYADNTKLLPFYINSEEYKNVPMMYQKNEFKCGNIEDLRAEYIELPYKVKKKKIESIFLMSNQ